jgi:hypothetical protein
MYKVTKEMRRKLNALASQMPKTYYEYLQNVSGATLLAQDSTMKNSLVKPIDPKKIYTKTALRPVNHKNRLIQAYKSGGQEAVELYCRQIQELIKTKTPGATGA